MLEPGGEQQEDQLEDGQGGQQVRRADLEGGEHCVRAEGGPGHDAGSREGGGEHPLHGQELTDQGPGAVEQAQFYHKGQAREDGPEGVHDHKEQSGSLLTRGVVGGDELVSVRKVQQVLGTGASKVQPTQTQITDFWRVSFENGPNSLKGVHPHGWLRLGESI